MIGELLTAGRILLDLEETGKELVLERLGETLLRDGIVTDLQGYLADVASREALGTTGVGHGVAIPHAKSSHVAQPGIAMGRTREGVEVGSMDGTKARIFFLIAVPQGEHGEHLKALSNIARLLMHDRFREGLLSASSPEEAHRLIVEMESQLD
ncbi:PTS system, fructose subfamily, IIA component [Thermanaerovibrio velox DSM 12556]|uniref:PTS system, fructose subfamily, IIA component n=1 Tax=Thermanaerovibrio velox DSM 12556 TaxID=926567 RepID=H0UN15_9BACT|nr:PTS sugar transporter subunit IIA [Thermanaerovibrio velox]EHM09294.1 PTS system, fructose subfamily, IIA component [Thermanaerovibrio velox DSM 12556]